MSRPRSLDRRRFLQAAGAAAMAMWPASALGIGPKSRFRLAQLQLGPNWNPRPSALRRMGWELEKRTSVDVTLDPVIVPPTTDKLLQNPILYLSGDRAIDLPNAPGLDALRRFLTVGGFLIIDSAEGAVGGAFDQSIRRLVGALFPPSRKEPGLALIAPDHVVYKSFYLLDQPVGRLALSPTMEGITHDGRLVAAYVQNDLGGAWARDTLGNFQFPCEPGGERQRELSFRLGINLIMYALCLDYKTDQVHVQSIMRRRRWRPTEPR